MIGINEYFNGAVKSLEYQSAEGRSTIGVIEKGEYEFGTSQYETMHIIEGELLALLPDSRDWKVFRNGGSFEVEANKSFKIKCAAQTSYLCKYK